MNTSFRKNLSETGRFKTAGPPEPWDGWNDHYDDAEKIWRLKLLTLSLINKIPDELDRLRAVNDAQFLLQGACSFSGGCKPVIVRDENDRYTFSDGLEK